MSGERTADSDLGLTEERHLGSVSHLRGRDTGNAARLSTVRSPIIYDATLRRPACVLLQAMLGGTPRLANLFPADSWLLAPTPDMRRYRATPQEVEWLVQITKEQT